jgi:hypothetical protein
MKKYKYVFLWGEVSPSLHPGQGPVFRYPLLGVPGAAPFARFIRRPHPALSHGEREKIWSEDFIGHPRKVVGRLMKI